MLRQLLTLPDSFHGVFVSGGTMGNYTALATPAQAQLHLFSALASEGSASLIGDMRDIKGDGRYAKFSRDIARPNYRHLGHNFRLLGYITELMGRPRSGFRIRFEELYGLGFDGAFEEPGYYVGQQMAHEIVNDFGAAALPCVLSLPAENFVLAYERAVATGGKLEDSYPLPSAMAEAARELARSRVPSGDLDNCLAQVRN